MSTRRADFRAALLAILDDFQTAHPTWLRQTWKARPATFYPPLAYVGPITEPSVTLQMGNRIVRPDLRSSLVLVEGVYDNAQAADALDEKGDALLTYLVTQHSRVSGATLIDPIGGPEDVDLTIAGDNPVTYAAVILPVRLNAVD
jgi:hypothetical protein